MKRPTGKEKKYHSAYGFDTALFLKDQAEWDAEQRAREDARKAQRWEKTQEGKNNRTGQPQTDTYFGDKGPGKTHAHVAHDSDGNFVFGRDVDGSAIDASQMSTPKE